MTTISARTGRSLVVLLALLPACGTTRAAKEAVEAIKDDADSRRALTDLLRTEVVPKLNHALDTLDEAAHGVAQSSGTLSGWMESLSPWVYISVGIAGPVLVAWLLKLRKRALARRAGKS